MLDKMKKNKKPFQYCIDNIYTKEKLPESSYNAELTNPT